MKFYESGNPGRKSIMLLPGNFMTHRQFEHIAPELAKEHYVISVDFDGYDETGKTTYTTAEDQAEKLAAYIREKLNGKIDLVYAESLGSLPAAFLTRHKELSIGGVVLSGVQYLTWGALDPLVVALSAPMTYWVMKHFVKDGEMRLPGFLVKSLGRNGDSMKALVRQLCQEPTLATTRATFLTATAFYREHVPQWEPNPDAHIALWYGSKEKNMVKAKLALQRAFPALQEHVFEGMGHGENCEHVDLVIHELKAFMGW